jgi:uncharacterized membrane protein YukC
MSNYGKLLKEAIADLRAAIAKGPPGGDLYTVNELEAQYQKLSDEETSSGDDRTQRMQKLAEEIDEQKALLEAETEFIRTQEMLKFMLAEEAIWDVGCGVMCPMAHADSDEDGSATESMTESGQHERAFETKSSERANGSAMSENRCNSVCQEQR